MREENKPTPDSTSLYEAAKRIVAVAKGRSTEGQWIVGVKKDWSLLGPVELKGEGSEDEVSVEAAVVMDAMRELRNKGAERIVFGHNHPAVMAGWDHGEDVSPSIDDMHAMQAVRVMAERCGMKSAQSIVVTDHAFVFLNAIASRSDTIDELHEILRELSGR